MDYAKFSRLLVPAILSNCGMHCWKNYTIKLAGGAELSHIGYTHHTFDGSKRRHKDSEFDGEINGFVEVILYKAKSLTTVLIEPPQCAGGDHSGLVEVEFSSLSPIPASESNYGRSS